MLPRRSLSSSSLPLTLLSLVALWARASSITTTTLTVNLTDAVAGSHGTVTAPEVCLVTFLYPDEYTVKNQACVGGSLEQNNCTVERNDSSLSVRFEKEDSEDVIEFTVTFDSDMDVNCSSYIPHTLAGDQGDAVFTCDPVYACNSSFPESTDLLRVRWWRFTNSGTVDSFLTATDRSNFSDYEVQLSGTGARVVMVNGSTQLEINFLSEDYEVLGYYVPTFEFNATASGEIERNGQLFIVYSHPNLDRSSGDREIVFGSDGASDYRRIYCRFSSFPPANITWESPSDNFMTIDIGDQLADETSPTLSLNGRLVFDEVRYEDGGDYRCIADNGISTETPSSSLRFRVRDPLRPLWPAIGIICSFIITALFIFGGAVVDKIRGKHASADDDGSFQRNYSVVSNLGEESGNSGDIRHSHKSHQSAGKRISITRQELLPNAQDSNN